MTPWIEGLRAIADRFDAVLVDQYGVLHDGRRAFPGAADCLRALRAAGKRIAVVSNSGKRAGPNPWGASGLEWETASPPITTNFEEIPIVTKEAYEYDPESDDAHDFVHEDEEREEAWHLEHDVEDGEDKR